MSEFDFSAWAERIWAGSADAESALETAFEAGRELGHEQGWDDALRGYLGD